MQFFEKKRPNEEKKNKWARFSQLRRELLTGTQRGGKPPRWMHDEGQVFSGLQAFDTEIKKCYDTG